MPTTHSKYPNNLSSGPKSFGQKAQLAVVVVMATQITLFNTVVSAASLAKRTARQPLFLFSSFNSGEGTCAYYHFTEQSRSLLPRSPT